MAATLALGRVPGRLTVALVQGADFTSTLRAQDTSGAATSWPQGTVLRLVLTADCTSPVSRSWDWSIDGELATLTVPASDVDELFALDLHAQLWLDYGDGEFLWMAGPVSRYA